MYTARALVPRALCCGRKQTAPQVMGGGGGGGDACCCCISSRLLRLRSSLSAARRLRAFSLSSRSLSFRLLSSLCPSRRRLFSRSAFFWTSRVSASRAAWRSLLRSPLRQHWGGIWRKARKKRIDAPAILLKHLSTGRHFSRDEATTIGNNRARRQFSQGSALPALADVHYRSQ